MGLNLAQSIRLKPLKILENSYSNQSFLVKSKTFLQNSN